MITFKLQVENAKKVEFAFGAMASAVSDWRKYIWPGVRGSATKVTGIRGWLKLNFNLQGAKGAHGSWSQLKEPYRSRKAKAYPGTPILEASGRMKKDLLSDSNEGETTARTMLYGTNIKYAKYHQTGTKNMAARRIFDPEESEGPGTMKSMIKIAVGKGVSNYARKLGFAILKGRGEAADIKRAGALGHQAMQQGWASSVSEGL